MSSRFLKRVVNVYGKGETNLEQPNEEDESVEELRDSFSNKFSLFSNDLTDSEEEQDSLPVECNEINSNDNKKPKKNKFKKQKKGGFNKFNEMTEEQMMDMFCSMDANVVVKEKISNPTDALALKIRNLNETIELQQLFGPAVALAGAPNDRLRQRNPNPLTKFTFGKRNANWPNTSLGKLGLRMELIGNGIDEFNWCIVTCSDEYLQAERALKTTMRTGDFQDHLRKFPYHVNTLLQMATMLVNQEDFSLAADLWKRIFYVYETITPSGLSLLGSNSAGSLSKTNFSLDYRFRPNRGIFIALFQWIQYLCQKSCFNTALEYCKVLLSINTKYDPLAIILLIDDIAIRSDQYDFLITFYNQFLHKKSLKYLPNYAFSMAICYFFKSSHNKKENSDLSTASDLLQEALCLFPTFLKSFAEHCSVQVDEKIAKSSLFSRNDDPTSLDILIRLYTKRSINFWKNTAVMKWMETNANCVLAKLESSSDEIEKERKRVIEMYSRETPLAVKRHVALSGHGELVPQFGNGLPYLVFDPYPPVNSDGGFDHYVESDAELRLDGSWLMNLLRSFSPSFGV